MLTSALKGHMKLNPKQEPIPRIYYLSAQELIPPSLPPKLSKKPSKNLFTSCPITHARREPLPHHDCGGRVYLCEPSLFFYVFALLRITGNWSPFKIYMLYHCFRILARPSATYQHSFSLFIYMLLSFQRVSNVKLKRGEEYKKRTQRRSL